MAVTSWDQTSDSAASGMGRLWRLACERPFVAGAASLAVGLLAGLALPATRREDELLGETRDDLVESAREVGKEALERGRGVAAGAVERVKESVREQELLPDQLAAKARQVARDAAETLRDAERQVMQDLGVAGGQSPVPPLEPPQGTPPRL